MKYFFAFFLVFLVSCTSCSKRQVPNTLGDTETSTDSITFEYDTTLAQEIAADYTTETATPPKHMKMAKKTRGAAPPPTAGMEVAETKSVADESRPRDIFIENESVTAIPPDLPDLPVTPPVEIKKEHGILVYNIPDTMKLRTTYVLTIRINRDTTDKKILDLIPKGISTVIKTTEQMEVTLVDPSPSDNKAFDIIKSNDASQHIDTDEYTEWIFNVTPLRSGKFSLNLVVKNNGKQVVYFKGVTVKSVPGVVVKTWWDKYWQWTFSTLLIPFGIWLYNKRKKKS